MMVKLLRLVLLIASLLFSMNAHAGNWYADPNASGANNGTSWANAWTSTGAINWSSINPGDTLFLSGGSTSQTYTAPLVIGKSGTAGNSITIRIGQDAGHNGTAVFDGGGGTSHMIDLGANKYITIDGDYQGARHLILQNNSGTGDNPLLYGFASNSNFMAGITVKNLEVKQSGSGIKIAYVGGAQRAEFSNLYIHDIRCEAGLDLDGAQDRVGGNLYDTGALIHDNIIQVNNQGADNGLGPDAIQCTNGCTLYNNIITAAPGTMSCSQHQDGLQVGGTYYKAYNNSFYCLANASIEATNWAGDAGHLRAWNNTFAQCSTQPNSHAFDTYTESGALDDVLVYENTFADFTGFIGVRLDLGSTSIPITNSAIKNNIFYNVGTPIRAANGNYTCGSGLVIDSNNINAGAGGGTSTICDGSSYNSSNLQTGAPVFVSYTQYSSGNDFHLQASSDADIGHGANLGSPYDLDKDGRSRGSSWDIGAYQFASRPDPPFITDVVVH